MSGDIFAEQAIKLTNDAYNTGYARGRAEACEEAEATITELKDHLSLMRETAKSAQRDYEAANAAFRLCAPIVEYVVAKFADGRLQVPLEVLQRRSPVGEVVMATVTAGRNEAENAVEVATSSKATAELDSRDYYEKELRKAQAMLGEVSDALTVAARERDDYLEAANTWKGEAENARQTSATLRHKLDQAERDLPALSQQIDDYKDRYRKMREQRDESRACIKKKLDTIERLTAERDKLQRGYKAVREERDDAFRQRDEAKDSLVRITRDYQQSNKVRNDLRERLALYEPLPSEEGGAS